MNWSNQQNEAINAVRAWLKDKRGAQVFRLFGYAGTGKTTLAKHLADDVKGEVRYACFTGKAALVLRKKGCTGASTIHSLIYKPVEDPVTGHTTFKLNPDSALAGIALLIIDEVSMVSEEMALDLLTFGIRILVLGDPAQLPPVKGDGYFINAEPDYMLTEVHRQAAESPIIRMSMDVRLGKGLQPGMYGNCAVLRRGDVGLDEMRERVLKADQLLCGMNKTRQAFNARSRQLKDIAGDAAHWHPAKGEPLVCLKNNHKKGLLNGSLWSVHEVAVKGQQFNMVMLSIDEPGTEAVDVEVPFEFFQGTEKELDWRDLKRADQFTFGQALTVHKAQGSQWDNVLLFDESNVFREDSDKHLYTGLTRAADELTVIV